ncbi:MAG: hypothetical protein AB8B60_20115 [Sulfitobacter sp.]
MARLHDQIDAVVEKVTDVQVARVLDQVIREVLDDWEGPRRLFDEVAFGCSGLVSQKCAKGRLD